MIKRDKATGRLCRVYAVEGSAQLWRDSRLVLLGTKDEPPPSLDNMSITYIRENIAVRTLDMLEPVNANANA